MEASAILWQQTSIPQVLDIFTGKVAQYIQEYGLEDERLLRTHLFSIFRRWYFTKTSQSWEASPAERIAYLQKIEKWPKGGHFFCSPQIKPLKSKQNSIEIVVDISYIKFSEQPLLKDVVSWEKNTNKSQLILPDDTEYAKTVKMVAENYRKNKEAARITENETETVKDILNIFLSTLGQLWREADPFIQASFTLDKISSVYKSMLKQALENESKGIDIDDLCDLLVAKVRRNFPGWALATDELEQKEKSGKFSSTTFERMQIETFYMLGINLDRFFLTPLSSYLQLLTPYYMDAFGYEEDLQIFFKQKPPDPQIFWSKPPASFRLTEFGKFYVLGLL